MTRVQGAEYTDELYAKGTSKKFQLRGEPVESKVYFTYAKKVTPIGSTSYTDLYQYDSSLERYVKISGTLYRAGTEVTYYTRILAAEAGDLFWSGGDKTVTVQPSKPISEKLYKKGTEYKEGLYAGYKKSSITGTKKLRLATITTRDVTALTTGGASDEQ